jgi:thiol-disulfide isomerase/thioredoxin
MKKMIIWLCVAAALVLFFVGASALYEKLSGDNKNGNLIIDAPQGSQSASSSDSKKDVSTATDTQSTQDGKNLAPNFTMLDKDGKTVELSSKKGKPIILNFWASWCPPCKAEMPDFEEAYKKYGDEVEFMMVNLTDGYQETLQKAKEHVSSNGYTFPVYFDTESSGAYAYNISSVPATYVIDTEGNIVAHAIGMMTAEDLETAITLVTK